MIYVLIFVWWQGQAMGSAPTTATTAEFNSVEACRAAADEILRRAKANPPASVPLLMCAAKGKPQ